MTTLGIHYLTGCAVATDRTRSDGPEYPPHFGRVFMALAATYFETRGDHQERAALQWLESAPPPIIEAGEGFARSNVKTYVPVNDKLDGGAPPLLRSRQSRAFPTMRLHDPFVYLRWNVAVPEHLRGALDRLCAKVTRIGHSSSLVHMWLADDNRTAGDAWEPISESGDLRMRIAEPGTLSYLERVFNAEGFEQYARLNDELETAQGKSKKELKDQLAQFPKGGPARMRPVLTRWQGYVKNATRVEAVPPIDGPFDSRLIVFAPKPEQPIMGLESTLQLTSALRDAAMKAVGDKVPEWLSGHRPDGRASLKPHAAFFPLPFVESKYADGHVMGLAMAVPRVLDPDGETSEESLRRVIGSLLFGDDGEERTVTLWRSKDARRVWQWQLEREKRETPPLTLRASTWTCPAEQWASVTPVILHHYPKRRPGDLQRIVFKAFEQVGLPRPAQLRIQPVSAFTGALPAKSMPEFTEGGAAMCRYQTHIVVRFASPLRGPLLVGRGRFRGYGLLRPLGGNHA
jgi:CRISPR-associated protein Csb2